jgi:hypothetical protein
MKSPLKICCLGWNPIFAILCFLVAKCFLTVASKIMKFGHSKFNFLRQYWFWTAFFERYNFLKITGDGQVDFKSIFSKLSGYNFDGWAVLEWECCIKSPEQGAAEGAPFIQNHIIEVTDKAFDDFASSRTDEEANKKILGI